MELVYPNGYFTNEINPQEHQFCAITVTYKYFWHVSIHYFKTLKYDSLIGLINNLKVYEVKQYKTNVHIGTTNENNK